jgi:hypothetical protein
MELARLHAYAERLAGTALGDPQATFGGANNRLFRVAGADRVYALKYYAGDEAERAERCGHEYGTLRFLWAHGERRIAEPVGASIVDGIAVYGWVDGTPVGTPSDDDVDDLATFAKDLHGLRTVPGADVLPLAREAVRSHVELNLQIAARLERFTEVAARHPRLDALLREITAELNLRTSEIDATELPRSAQTLSPSDFGFHNALRTRDGLVILDFEYFGWDDPVKLVADVLWHPGSELSTAARQRFYRRMADVYEMDSTFESRFERDARFYGLRWALIVLGEFLPDVWARRVASGSAVDPAASRARQLAKAQILVDRVRRGGVFV